MRVFTCTDFEGFFVGTAAVVVAESEESARKILSKALVEEGLRRLRRNDKIVELDITKNTVRFLQNGDY